MREWSYMGPMIMRDVLGRLAHGPESGPGGQVRAVVSGVPQVLAVEDGWDVYLREGEKITDAKGRNGKITNIGRNGNVWAVVDLVETIITDASQWLPQETCDECEERYAGYVHTVNGDVLCHECAKGSLPNVRTIEQADRVRYFADTVKAREILARDRYDSARRDLGEHESLCRQCKGEYPCEVGRRLTLVMAYSRGVSV